MRIVLALFILFLAGTAGAALSTPVSGSGANFGRTVIIPPGIGISNAIWNVPNNVHAIITPGSVTNALNYTNDANHAIKILSKTNVTFTFSGVLMYGFGAGSHVLVSNCNNVKFVDLAVIGNKPAGSVGDWILLSRGAFTAIDVRQSRDIIFERPYLKDHPNHGILCGDDVNVGQNVRIHSYNGYFENIGATNGVPGGTPSDGAVFVPGGNFCEFIGNVVTNCARGVELYSNVSDTKGWMIKNNYFLYMNWDTIINVSVFAIRDSCFENNVITGNPTAGLVLNGILMGHHSERNVIRGNQLDGMTGYGITLESTLTRPMRYNVIAFNTLTNCSTAMRMFPNGTLHSTNNCHNIIEGNVMDSGNIGIDGGGLFNKYVNNQITRFNTGFRMYHDGSLGETNVLNTIEGNTFAHNTTCIDLTSSTVRTNRIINNVFHRYTTAIINNGTGTITNLNHH